MSRLYGLLASGPTTPLTVITPWSALLRKVPPRAELRGRITHLERGMTVDRDSLLDVLVSAGYHRTNLVEERGEVALRGGIIDLYPPQLDQPVRLEFEGTDPTMLDHPAPVAVGSGQLSELRQDWGFSGEDLDVVVGLMMDRPAGGSR